MNFQEMHEIHGLSLGLILFAVTRNIPISLLVGGGAFAYMKRYGHSLPT